MSYITRMEWGPTPMALIRRGYGDQHPFIHKAVHAMRYRFCRKVDERDLLRFEVAPSTEKPEMLAYWPSREAYAQGQSKRVRARVGRVLLRIFPEIEPHEVEYLVDMYKRDFGPRVAAKYKQTSNTQEMVRVYRGVNWAPSANIDTNFYDKHASCSCMRYDFDHLEHHPIEAYGTGDFELHYLESDHGIHARSMVYISAKAAAPIYACDQHSLNDLKQKMHDAGLDFCDNSWEGARLKAIPHIDGGYIGPYLDYSPRALRVDGPYLVVDEQGDVDGSDHEGILGATCWSCPCCGYEADPEYRTHAYDTDREICDDCSSYCDHLREYVEGVIYEVATPHGYESWSEGPYRDSTVRHFDTNERWDDSYMAERRDSYGHIPRCQLDEYGYVLDGNGYAVLKTDEEEEENANEAA